MSCPVGVLLPGTPWGGLTEREREAWRVLADVAFRWVGPRPSDAILAEIRDTEAALLRTVRVSLELTPYARHLDGCAQAPCTCGLAELIAPPA
jgi:hypothetical protein